VAEALIPSNAIGQLDGGYRIQKRCQAFFFVLDFYSKGLGKVRPQHAAVDLAAPKWAPVLSCEEGEDYRRFEAQKVMILFEHVATAGELEALLKDVSTLAAAELARTVTEQAATIRTVLQRLEQYLVQYELRDPNVKQRTKKATLTSLCGRHKNMKFVLHDDILWRAQLLAKNAPGSGGEIVEWHQVDGQLPQQQQEQVQQPQQQADKGRKRRKMT
jgi:hypothetical protein